MQYPCNLITTFFTILHSFQRNLHFAGKRFILFFSQWIIAVGIGATSKNPIVTYVTKQCKQCHHSRHWTRPLPCCFSLHNSLFYNKNPKIVLFPLVTIGHFYRFLFFVLPIAMLWKKLWLLYGVWRELLNCCSQPGNSLLSLLHVMGMDHRAEAMEMGERGNKRRIAERTRKR